MTYERVHAVRRLTIYREDTVMWLASMAFSGSEEVVFPMHPPCHRTAAGV